MSKVTREVKKLNKILEDELGNHDFKTKYGVDDVWSTVDKSANTCFNWVHGSDIRVSVLVKYDYVLNPKTGITQLEPEYEFRHQYPEHCNRWLVCIRRQRPSKEEWFARHGRELLYPSYDYWDAVTDMNGTPVGMRPEETPNLTATWEFIKAMKQIRSVVEETIKEQLERQERERRKQSLAYWANELRPFGALGKDSWITVPEKVLFGADGSVAMKVTEDKIESKTE